MPMPSLAMPPTARFKTVAIYNAQLLKEEIETLENLKATFLLVSRFAGFVRRKEDVIAELRAIYETRNPGVPEIVVGRVAE